MDNLIDSLIKSRYKVNFDFSTRKNNNSDSLIEWVNTLEGNILDIYSLLKQHKTSKLLTNFPLTEDATVTTDKRDYSPSETAFISGSGFALGETIQLQVLHTDGRDNTRPEHQPWEITDGVRYYDDAGNLAGDLDGLVDGNIETSWFVDPYDSANSAFILTATGLTSGEVATHNFTDSDPAVQFFYIPSEEPNILSAIQAIVNETDFDSTTNIETIVSITVSTDNSIIYYDHWEDGFETDIDSPTQSSTEVWGDNDPNNGIAPGFTTDLLNAGDIIALENSVAVATTQSVVDYDGRDKIGASKAIVVSRAAYPDESNGTLIAGAVEVYDTTKWGTEYQIPIGEDFTASNNFEYTSIFITASTDGTTLNLNGSGVDIDGDLDVDANDVLNEGETYFVDGGINTGDTFVASNPIQAQLLTGDIGSRFASRSYTLLPTSEWSDTYYTPVGTIESATQTNDTDVFLYNPDLAQITVDVQTQEGITEVDVPARTVVRHTLTTDSAAKFEAQNEGDNFFAVTTFDSEGSRNDWGFSLVPESNLTPLIQVGWGPGNGSDPPSENGNPLWVMATAPTTIYIDYDGDGVAPNTDINGDQYDEAITLAALQSERIDDDDNDQSGIRVYTVDGTNLVGAWGQDPSAAAAGTSLDLGTTVLPLPISHSWKEFELVNDVDGDGEVDPGDTLEFTINIENQGVVVLGNVNVSDIVPDGTTYVPGTTTINGVPVGDDAAGTAFTLNDDNIDNGIDAGKNIGSIPVGGSAIVTVQMLVNDPYDGDLGGIINSATVDSDEETLSVAVNVPVDQTGVQTKTLYLSETNNLDRIDPANSNPVDNSESETTTLSTTTTTNTLENAFDSDWTEINDDNDFNNGNVIVSSGELQLDDNPDSGGQPGIERALDLSGAVSATLSFDFDISSGVDTGDTVTLDISNDGGDNYTTLETFTGIDGDNGSFSGPVSRTYDLENNINLTANTEIRFRVTNLYGGGNEVFSVDNLNIQSTTVTGDSETFTQSIPMRDSFTVDADGTISVTAYIDMSSGTPDTNSGIVATLEYGATPTTLATLSNPTSVTAYDAGDGRTDVYEVTWTTTLGSDVTIPSGDSVNLEITNNDANLDFTVLYDSDDYASKIDLPTDTVIDITNIGIYDASGVGNGNLITEATDGDTVYLRTTVTDPFGEEDITKLDLVITDPLGNTTTIDGNPTTIEVDDTDANTDNDSEDYDVDSTASDNTRIYEFPWTPTGNLGDYTIEITAHEGYETGNAAITDTGITSLRLQDTIIPDIIIGDASVIEGNQLVFDVSLLTTETTTSDIVLDLAASTETGNTATEISDYETTNLEYSIDGGNTWISAGGTNGTEVTIPVGNSGIKVRIDSTSDASDEPDETFTLGVGSVVSGSVGDSSDTGTGTILDDDATPTISIDDVSLTEGDNTSAKKQFNFTVSLSNPSSQTVTVEYNTANIGSDPATAGSDYDSATNETVTFAPGETSKTITILVTGEIEAEPDETFAVNLSNPSNATIDDSQGIGTILNDDNTPLFTIDDVSNVEGDSGTQTYIFTVTRSGNTTDAVNIDYATADNTATTGDNDYESASGTLTFGSGITTQTISVTINGDTPPEGDDTFFVNLFNAINVTTPSNGATISDSQGIGTIVNDDASGSISGNVQADTNNDDTADSPLSGVTVELLDSDGNSIDSDETTSGVQPTTTTTDGNGDYEFTNVTPGDYLIKETDPTGYTSVSDEDSTDATDDNTFSSNTSPTDNLIPVTISDGEVDSGNDFVDEPTGTISGEVLADTNNDDVGDTPLEGVTVELLDNTGQSIDSDPNTTGVQPTTTTTDSNGGYSFTNLPPGDYQVQQTNLSSYSDVKDFDTNVDGTANGSSGNTDQNLIDVSLSPGENDTGNDFVDERGVISGNVTEDTNGDTTGENSLANITIELLDSGSNVVATTTTDASGNYSFTDLEPDTYTVRQTDFSGYDSVIDNDEIDDDGGAGGSDDDTNSDTNNNELTVDLAAGEEDTGNNFVDRVQSGVISGRVLEDTTGNGIGDTALSGVTLTLKDGSGNDIDSDLGTPGVQPTTTTTASDGIYSFTGLADGNYQVVETNLANYTDVSDSDGNSNGDNTIALTLSGSSTGNDFVDEAQTGSISGTVKADTTGNGVGDTDLENVTLALLDSNGSPVLNGSGNAITTTTNASGAYTFSNVPPGDYQVVETDPSGYSSVIDEDSDDSDDSNSNTNDNILTVSLSAGENDSGNDFVDQQNGTISGQVLEDTDNDNSGDDPISGVTLTLKDSNGNTVATTTTNSSGNYTFSDVTPGDYTVEETDPNGYSSVTDEDSVTDSGGNDGEIGSDGVNDNTISVSLLPNEIDSGNDFVDEQNTATGTISGTVTEDTDGDGEGNIAISGVTIKLFNEDGTVEIDSTTTDSNGDYSFTNVTTGTAYQVIEINNAGFGDVNDRDSFSDGTEDTDLEVSTSNNDNILTVVLDANETADTGNDFVDAQDASISGVIWSDANSNGVDDSESGVDNLTVILIGGGSDGVIGTGNDDTTETVTTSGGGGYSFTGLNPGEEYQVTFPTSATGYSGLTNKDQGGDDAIDSDADPSTGIADIITLAANEDKIDVDAGLLISSINLEGTNVSEDTLSGGSGDETIAGYKGQDTLTGGGGSDTFFFNETSEGVDVITDFNDSGSDQIDLRQILANEVPAADSSNLFSNGYVLFTQYSTLGTMVQIDFDGSAGSRFPKSVVLLQGDDVGTLDTTNTTGNNDFFFF